MSRLKQITHEFVTFVPNIVQPGVAYVSMEYATVVHLCCCGCGNKVVTPLAPGRWHLTFDDESISLTPSIGNWSFPCQSHYWIHHNQIIWERAFNTAQIAAVRAADRRALQPGQPPWWLRLLRWFKR
jgi:hypothetical protein